MAEELRRLGVLSDVAEAATAGAANRPLVAKSKLRESLIGYGI